jgi:hypothetical protein
LSKKAGKTKLDPAGDGIHSAQSANRNRATRPRNFPAAFCLQLPLYIFWQCQGGFCHLTKFH